METNLKVTFDKQEYSKEFLDILNTLSLEEIFNLIKHRFDIEFDPIVGIVTGEFMFKYKERFNKWK